MSTENRSRLHPGRVKRFSAGAWLAAIVMFAGHAHAQLIDLGDAHLDTQSGLEWRDMGTVGW